MTCEYCLSDGGETIWKDADCRVVWAPEPAYQGFCRVIWHEHVKEMSDLSDAQRKHLMDVVFALEAALIELLQPEKINLASLGNLTPHLHWHVIPRFRDDRHFPAPVWAAPCGAGVIRARPEGWPQALRRNLATRLGST